MSLDEEGNILEVIYPHLRGKRVGNKLSKTTLRILNWDSKLRASFIVKFSTPQVRRYTKCCYGFSNETWNMTLYWWMQYFWITKATFSDAPCHSVLFHEKDIEIERRGVFEEMSLQYLKGAEEPISMSAVSYVMYRRHYLNKPQTLNDKCSNQDSSCYIDDSTLRENSEEMYSLDNDSFLNSLEAMTIQNYWTDSVKHTKL
uniref:Uncharacterized protein n=1 Tax=Timema douglasi TaxID=61478 RepID=A0A7R8VKU9_TIMDO|nr:unnamed protein product [Timema douglasi]